MHGNIRIEECIPLSLDIHHPVLLEQPKVHGLNQTNPRIKQDQGMYFHIRPIDMRAGITFKSHLRFTISISPSVY